MLETIRKKLSSIQIIQMKFGKMVRFRDANLNSNQNCVKINEKALKKAIIIELSIIIKIEAYF